LTISDEDLVSLDNANDSTSTKWTVSRSVKLFRDFLGPERAKFEDMPKNALNINLRLFFASVRTVKGDELKTSSLHNIKYGLSKYLIETYKVDISSDSEFSSTVKTFHAKRKNLQKKGKGSVEHKHQITEHHLQRLNDPATGHKSETSIKSYSRRLTESTQREMHDALSSALSAKPVVNTDVHCEQNLCLNATELTTDDLYRMFSESNDFSQIELPTPPVTISTHLQSTATTTNYRVDHQMNVAQVIPGSPQILNLPQNSSGYCNVAPNIHNCIVNFYFNSK